MVKPERVNPANFAQDRVVFKNNDFSVVFGTWQPDGEGRRCLGIRWNGGAENPLGHPSSRGHPVWFVVPSELAVPILLGLAGQSGLSPDAALKALRELAPSRRSRSTR